MEVHRSPEHPAGSGHRRQRVEIPSDAWDYNEIVVLSCRVPECGWEMEIGWGDIPDGGMELLYRPHWEPKHGS